MKQTNLKYNILEFNRKVRPRSTGDKWKKNTFKSANIFLKVVNAFKIRNAVKSGIFFHEKH